MPDVLVADANVVISALIGGRARQVLLDESAPAVVAAVEVGEEILQHLPSIARKRKLDVGELLPVLAVLPMEWADPESYSGFEEEARTRLKQRDEDDWPTVAVALSLGGDDDVAIWTQDRDFDVSGLPCLNDGRAAGSAPGTWLMA